MKLLKGVVVTVCVSLSVSAWAYEPLRNAKQLNAPKAETVVQVRTARVILADYGLLKRDFPQLRALNDAQIDDWLLQKTAFISRAQAAQTEVNTPIETTNVTTRALRPDDYGRALVYEVGRQGGTFLGGGAAQLIDGKGAGAFARPHAGGHGDGLATTGEAIREFLYEKLARTVFVHSGSGIETVEHYGVIDWGFDVVFADGTHEPAGMILRQAHKRKKGDFSVFNDAAAKRVERVLRPYGVTTAGAYRTEGTFERVNVQGTADGAILDFGGFLTVDRFHREARNFYTMRPLFEEGHIDFVQPIEAKRVPFDVWGYTVTGIEDPKMDNPWVWSHELARNLRDGRATRESTQVHFDNLVGSYRRKLFGMAGSPMAGVEYDLMQLLRGVH